MGSILRLLAPAKDCPSLDLAAGLHTWSMNGTTRFERTCTISLLIAFASFATTAGATVFPTGTLPTFPSKLFSRTWTPLLMLWISALTHFCASRRGVHYP